MARTKGTSKLSASLEVQAGAPLDARTVVPTYADLTKPETFQYKYVGMPVVVQETGEMYILTDMDNTLKSNWKAGSSAKGDPAYISVAKSGYVTTVTAEDVRGTTVTYITDGKDGVDGVDGISPTVSIGNNGTWVINSIDTGVKATGEKGERGEGFSIDAKYDTVEDMVADTDNVPDSKMAVVIANKQLYLRVEGYTEGDYNGWMEIGGIGDLNTIKGDPGEKGADGVNGITPTIDPTTKHWMIGDSDTGIVAEGKNGTNGTNGINGTNGTTPTISSTNRHWMIGSYDTGILAQGFTPTIGINASGNWVINDVDTGKTAYPIINGQKHWVVNGTDTNIIAEGQKGDKGDTGDEGFSPAITQERDDNKVTLTINQKTGTETVEIFDGLNSYNDLELRGRIGNAEAAIETLNGDETVEGSVEAKIVEAFSKFTSIKFEKVNSLPATGENGVFYLVPATNADASNHYNEYIYIDGAWEFLGTTEIDLSAYAKKTEIPTKVSQLTNDSGYVVNTQKASTTDLGLVKVDGTTITIDANGVIKGTTEIGISEESDNVLTAKTDGLYVPPTDLSTYAKSNAIPTKVSQLTNDSGYITSAAVPTALSELENDLIATTLKAGTVIPDGDTITTDANGRITAKIGENSLSRDEGNQIELHEDGIYISALNEEAIYNSIDAVDLASPILTEYTEDELYHLAWEEIEVKEKEEYTEAELDEMLDEALDGIDFLSGGGSGSITSSYIFDVRGTEYEIGSYIDANGNSTPIYEKVYNLLADGLVPIMSSSTSDVCTITSNGEYEGNKVWYAFDNDNSTRWVSTTNNSGYIIVTFATPRTVQAISIKPQVINSISRVKEFEIIASNDNFSTSETLYSGTCTNTDDDQVFEFNNEQAYTSYKINIKNIWTSELGSVCILALQLYGDNIDPATDKILNTVVFGNYKQIRYTKII